MLGFMPKRKNTELLNFSNERMSSMRTTQVRRLINFVLKFRVKM